MEKRINRIVIFIGILIILSSGGAVYYLYEVFSPRNVPAEVIAAENAISPIGTIAIASIDMDYVKRIDSFINSKEDPSPILNPKIDNSLIGKLQKRGINPIKQTNYVIAAVNISPKGARHSIVLFGDFSTNIIREELSKEFIVKEDKAGFLTFEKRTNVHNSGDPCSVPSKRKAKSTAVEALHIQNDRIIISSPDFMPTILKRFNEKTTAGVDLTKWQEFRSDKILAGAIIAPKDVSKGTSDFMTAALLDKSVSKQPIDNIYGGAIVNLFPPLGLKLLLDVHSQNSVWPISVQKKYNEWVAETKNSLKQMPTIAKLNDSFAIQVKDNILHASATVDQQTVENFKKIPGEFMSMLFSGMDGSSSKKVGKAGEEEILLEKDLTKFIKQFSISSIAPYDAKSNFEKPDTTTGPFAITLEKIGLLATDDSIILLSIKAEGKGLKNISEETLHTNKSVSLKILSVEGQQDNELLREEQCGLEHNLTSTELRISPHRVHKDGKWIVESMQASGSKEIRLKKNSNIKQVNKIKGEISIEVASQVKTKIISAPFAGQVIETDQVRIYFKNGGPSSVKYEVSGKIHQILSIRALNAKGRYLRSGGASSFGESGSKTVNKTIKGTVTSIEVIYAQKMEKKIFPFEINGITPKFRVKNAWQKKEPHTVKETSKKIFKAAVATYKYPPNDFMGIGKDKSLAKAGPFIITLEGIKDYWGTNIGGYFYVNGPDFPSLSGNLSAVELFINKLITENGKEVAFNVSEKIFLERSGVGPSDNLQYYLSRPSNSVLTAKYVDNPELKNIKAKAVKGKLKIKLPKKIYSLTLDGSALGAKKKNKNGLTAKLARFENKKIILELQGPVENLVQIRPRNEKGKVLYASTSLKEKQVSTWSLSKEEKEKLKTQPKIWEAHIDMFEQPAHIDIFYAHNFDELEYPFEVDLTKKVKQEPIIGQKSVKAKKRVSRTSLYKEATKNANLKEIPKNNILLNGNFEKKLRYWTVKDPITLAVGKGVEGSNALFMNAPYIAPSKYIYELSASECVKINDAVRFSVEAMFQYDSLPIKRSGHRLNLYWFEDENCSRGGQYATYLEPKLKLGWQKVHKDSIKSSLNASSVKILATQNQRSSAKAITSDDETPTLASAYWDNIKIIATHISNGNKDDSHMTNNYTLSLGENYIQNGSFDKNRENWRASVATTWSKDEGKENAGAIRTTLESASGSIGTWAFSQCVNFGSQKYFEMGANYKHDKTSTQKGGGRLRVTWYEHEDCEGRYSSSIKHVNPKQINGWQALKVIGLKAAKGSKSANIDIVKSIQGKGAHSAYWDDVYFKAVSQQ